MEWGWSLLGIETEFVLFYVSSNFLFLTRVDLRWFRQKKRVLDLQRTGLMYFPGSRDSICISKPNIASLMICKIEIVIPQPVFYPIRHLDCGRSLNICTNTGVKFRINYGAGSNSGDL